MITVKSVKLAAAALVLGIGSNIASALPCDGFEIVVKNNLSAEDFRTASVLLENANISPSGEHMISRNGQQIFTVSYSTEQAMPGSFKLKTISIPSKPVTINYTLTNTGDSCSLSNVSFDGKYTVTQEGSNFTISDR